ncbi:unnamed protein product [Anisakis simplex]|nr:unnamed protein product [Anisakis simplex]
MRYQRSSPECFTISRFRIDTRPIGRGIGRAFFSKIVKCNCEKLHDISCTKSSPIEQLK